MPEGSGRRTHPIAIMLGVAGLTALAGAAATGLWIRRAGGIGIAGSQWGAVLPGLLLVSLFTLSNLMLRWLRWHFLLRKLNLLIRTKESFFSYMAALPFMATPFSIGELVRIPMLRIGYPGSGWRIFLTWLLERATDLLVLCLIAALAMGRWDMPILAAFAWIMVVLLWLSTLGQWSRYWRRNYALVLAVLLGVTALTWLLPGAALWLLMKSLGTGIGAAGAQGAYSYSTVLGGLSSAPLGVGVTGSLMVRALSALGATEQGAVLATIIFRAGTTYFAIAFGLFVMAAFLRQVKELVYPPKAGSHFDQIAPEYQGQIPPHIVDRLIDRKSRLMRQLLEEQGIGENARGLDVGCGQGYYASRMAAWGYRMSGMDASGGQVEHARRYAKDKGVKVEFSRADATALPFEDGGFDFAYAINIFHHIKGADAKSAALAEVMRVLRPGGIFFLHEINIRNPLFSLYMNYVFPLIRTIDEGDEEWVLAKEPPMAGGAKWPPEAHYFTFLPDFLPEALLRPLAGVEAMLERSRLGQYSAHFMLVYRKKD